MKKFAQQKGNFLYCSLAATLFFSFGTENLEEVKFYRFNAFDCPHSWFTLDAQDKKLMTPFKGALELMRASRVPMGTGVDISERPVAALIKATFLEIARPPLVLQCSRR